MRTYFKNKKFLRIAHDIGTEICNQAFWSSNKCNWIGSIHDMSRQHNSVKRALSCDIYSGTSGISYFLMKLYDDKRNDNYVETAKGAINQATSHLENLSSTTRFGFYSGRIGVAYIAIKMAEMTCDNMLFEKGSKELQRLSKDFKSKHLFDIISGNAGAIPPLLDLYEDTKDSLYLDFAIELGKELIKFTKKRKYGWSWNYADSGVAYALHNLTGFSHGSAGISWSLLELFCKTDDKTFLEAAINGFKYENHWFNKDKKNWPDFRVFDETRSNKRTKYENLNHATAWCHGAPGIGLSRLRAFQILRDEEYLSQCKLALSTTKDIAQIIYSDQRVNDFTLCHGLSGIGDILLLAYETLNDDTYRELAQDIGLYGIEKYVKEGISIPTGVSGTNPSLMIGMAGVGYFYLRLCYENKLRSPLIALNCWASSHNDGMRDQV